MTTPDALKLARDALQSPTSRGPTWALIENYADAVCEYNAAVRIDVGIDKAGAECLRIEKELRAHLAAIAAIDAMPASVPATGIDEAQLDRMTERGAVAWAGVTDADVRALRDGDVPAVAAPEPVQRGWLIEWPMPSGDKRRTIWSDSDTAAKAIGCPHEPVYVLRPPTTQEPQ